MADAMDLNAIQQRVQAAVALLTGEPRELFYQQAARFQPAVVVEYPAVIGRTAEILARAQITEQYDPADKEYDAEKGAHPVEGVEPAVGEKRKRVEKSEGEEEDVPFTSGRGASASSSSSSAGQGMGGVGLSRTGTGAPTARLPFTSDQSVQHVANTGSHFLTRAELVARNLLPASSSSDGPSSPRLPVTGVVAEQASSPLRTEDGAPAAKRSRQEGGGLTIVPDMLEGGSSRSRERSHRRSSYRRKLL